jgi:phytoene/squalene synthetase
MDFEVARARRFLRLGSPLVASLRGRARVAVAAFVAGGHAALDALASSGFDPFADLARPRTAVALRHSISLLRASRAGRRVGEEEALSAGPWDPAVSAKRR